MAWEENPRICLHMQLIAILSRTGVIINFKVALLENGVIRRGHMENNLNNFYNK